MTADLARLFLGALIIALIAVPVVARLARKANFLDLPGPRKIHVEPVPYGGGLAVAAALLLGVWGATFFTAAVALPTVAALGSLAILVLGLVDDRQKLTARFKLAVQIIIALGVALGGQRFELFNAPPAVGIAVTVLWIVGVTNAFNLLDHMDGLTSGVAAIAGSAFLVVAIQTGQTSLALVLIALIGACLGFLAYNFPPAKIFLGDAGSLFIGFWIACLTVSFTFYEARYELYTYFVPLAILAVPLYDTASVVLIRLRRGRPIFEGDNNHLAHRLVALGLSRRSAVLAVYILTLATGISAVLLYHVSQRVALLILVQLFLTFGIIALLESAGRSKSG